MNWYEDALHLGRQLGVFSDDEAAVREKLVRPDIKPLSREQEESFLQRIAGAGLGGLGYVGSVLEKTFGGRAIRGALGGKPREILSILPFSDTLGITDYNDRVGGRDLLRQWRWIDPYGKDDWGNFSAGFGLELITDPGMILSFGSGALTKSGELALRAGRQFLGKGAAGRVGGTLQQIVTNNPGAVPLLEQAAGGSAEFAKHMAKYANEPLGGLFRVHLPFFRSIGFNVGEGAAGLKALDAMDKAGKAGWGLLQGFNRGSYLGNALGGYAAPLAGMVGNAMTYGVPWLTELGVTYGGKAADAIGRYGRAMFDSTVRGAVSKIGQETGEAATQLQRELLAKYRAKVAEYAKELKDLGDETGEQLRRLSEGVDVGILTPTQQKILDVGTRMRADVDDLLQQMQQAGVRIHSLEDVFAQYLPRYTEHTALAGSGSGGAQPALALRGRHILGREPILKNIRGGTEGVNAMFSDPAVYQPGAAAHIRSTYLPTPEELLPVLRQHAKSTTSDATLLKRADRLLDRQAAKLADYARSLPDEFRLGAQDALLGDPLRFFPNHPLGDLLTYLERATDTIASARASHGLLGKTATMDREAAGQGAMRLRDAVRYLFGDRKAYDPRVGIANVANEIRDPALRSLLQQEAINAGRDIYIPRSTIAEAQRVLHGFSSPEYTHPLLRLFDSITNLTKAYQTTIWPAFHMRNLASGLYQNLAHGGTEGSALKAAQAIRDANRLGKGAVIPDANKIPGLTHLTPEQATAALANEMFAWNIHGNMANFMRDVVGAQRSPVTLADILERIPGENPLRLGRTLLNWINPLRWESHNPLKVSGVGGQTKDAFGLVKHGRELGDIVENTNRNSLYVNLRRQGYSPAEAAREVLASHFDYSGRSATAFEREWMRRLVPFYTFTRYNIPRTIQNLIEHPGGMSGTLARAAHAVREGSPWIPSYLGAGLAAPIGEEKNGTQRFLTRLDTPIESAFEWLKGGPRGMENTLLGILAMTNPILKAPIELGTGKQFFSGRDLEDLYSLTGNTTLENLIMNSPVSRIFSTYRRIRDPRKWADGYSLPVNLLTGAQLSDIDIAKQREIAEREYMQSVLLQNPYIGKFETLAVKPEAYPFLTPAERELLQVKKTLEMRAREAAKKQREAAKQQHGGRPVIVIR